MESPHPPPRRMFGLLMEAAPSFFFGFHRTTIFNFVVGVGVTKRAIVVFT